jgi:hypothetical protein
MYFGYTNVITLAHFWLYPPGISADIIVDRFKTALNYAIFNCLREDWEPWEVKSTAQLTGLQGHSLLRELNKLLCRSPYQKPGIIRLIILIGDVGASPTEL